MKKKSESKPKEEPKKPEEAGRPEQAQPDTKPLTIDRKEPIANHGQSQAQLQTELKPAGVQASKPEQGVIRKPEVQQPPRPEQKPEPKLEPHARTQPQPQQAQPRPEGQASKPEQGRQKPQQKPQAQDTLKGFVGKDVVLTLRGGAKMKGRLESVAQYDLVITTSYKPVIVLKHAVERAGA